MSNLVRLKRRIVQKTERRTRFIESKYIICEVNQYQSMQTSFYLCVEFSTRLYD